MDSNKNVPKSLHNIRRRRVSQQERPIDIPDGDPNYGKKVFDISCRGCHAMYEDGPLGPALYNVYLRRNGSRGTFKKYSGGMRKTKFYWSREKLYEFIRDPQRLIPDTNMIYDGLKDPYDLSCVIEYMIREKMKRTDDEAVQEIRREY